MQGQRGWRELAILGDKINKFTGMIEGLIWSPRGSDSNNHRDDWSAEEVIACFCEKSYHLCWILWANIGQVTLISISIVTSRVGPSVALRFLVACTFYLELQ